MNIIMNYDYFLNLQINILIFLQNIRIEQFDFLIPFFLSITKLGEFFIVTTICCLIYWCIDSVKGIYLISLASVNVLISQFLKMLACVYRPWILSDKVEPVRSAIPYAKGYSFPSGHSAMASSVLGGFAYLLKHKIYSSIFVIVIFGVMFSRMWLGVHTPQDVLIGFVIGLILVFGLKPLVDYFENNKIYYLYALIIINVLTILSILFICYKSYPMDYLNGCLIVNPESSIYTYIICCSYSLGLISGAFLSRLYFPFETKNISNLIRILRGIFGYLLIVFSLHIINVYFFGNHQDYKLTLVVTSFLGFLITGIYPLVFMCVEKLFAKNIKK